MTCMNSLFSFVIKLYSPIFISVHSVKKRGYALLLLQSCYALSDPDLKKTTGTWPVLSSFYSLNHHQSIMRILTTAILNHACKRLLTAGGSLMLENQIVLYSFDLGCTEVLNIKKIYIILPINFLLLSQLSCYIYVT